VLLGMPALPQVGAALHAGNRGACKQPAALQPRHLLQVLKLGWSALGQRGARALAAGLQGNVGLQEMHLQWAGIGDSGELQHAVC
jgi:hypothetical protein